MTPDRRRPPAIAPTTKAERAIAWVLVVAGLLFYAWIVSLFFQNGFPA